MTTRRLSVAAAALLLLATLTACFPSLPNIGGGGGTPATGGGGTTSTDLAGTTWGGTDSDGDTWAFEFQNDGTVGLTYNGDFFDDATDTWTLDGTNLSIHIVGSDSDFDFAGPYDGGSSIPLTGTYSGGTFTVTVTPA
jgi:hypothetical protein